MKLCSLSPWQKDDVYRGSTWLATSQKMTSKLSVKRYLATATSRTLQRFEDSVDDHVGGPAAEGDLVAGVGFEIRSVVAEHVFHLVSAKHPALQSSPVRDRSPVDVRIDTDQTARWMLERR
jgi:hypothetical protein